MAENPVMRSFDDVKDDAARRLAKMTAAESNNPGVILLTLIEIVWEELVRVRQSIEQGYRKI